METKPKFKIGDIVAIKGEARIARWIITAISIQRDIMPIHTMGMPIRAECTGQNVIYHLRCAHHDPRYPHLQIEEPQLLEECLEHAGNAIERIKRKLSNGE